MRSPRGSSPGRNSRAIGNTCSIARSLPHPPTPFGAVLALIGADGRLIGIGSLHVQHSNGRELRRDVNMVVPIDLLPPILDDMLTYGRPNRPPRPWLGLSAQEVEDAIVVAGLAERGPASKAGLRPGDRILAVREDPVASLAGLWRKVWAGGPAGSEIVLQVGRDNETLTVRVLSADRTRNSQSAKAALIVRPFEHRPHGALNDRRRSDRAAAAASVAVGFNRTGKPVVRRDRLWAPSARVTAFSAARPRHPETPAPSGAATGRRPDRIHPGGKMPFTPRTAVPAIAKPGTRPRIRGAALGFAVTLAALAVSPSWLQAARSREHRGPHSCSVAAGRRRSRSTRPPRP